MIISGPYGEFFIPDNAPADQEFIFIGGGAGMAPMRSHIMHLFKTEKTARKVNFFYGARSLKEAFYLEDFHEIERDFPNFKFHLALDRQDPEADAAGVAYKVGFVHNVLYETYLRTSDDDPVRPQDAGQPRSTSREHPLRQLRLIVPPRTSAADSIETSPDDTEIPVIRAFAIYGCGYTYRQQPGRIDGNSAVPAPIQVIEYLH